MSALEPVSLEAIREAQGRLTDTVFRTPLVRLNVDDFSDPAVRAGKGKVACVISGGNIDKSKLVRILQGEVP